MQMMLKSEASVAINNQISAGVFSKVGKTLKDVTTILKAQRFTTIDYIYVVDGNRKLIGVFPSTSHLSIQEKPRLRTFAENRRW